MTFRELKEVINDIEDRFSFDPDKELQLMFLNLNTNKIENYDIFSLFLDVSESVSGPGIPGLTISALNS